MKKNLILIVDDEASLIRMYENMLKAEGYEFVIANGGKEALCKIDEYKDIDLILLDVMMPDVNGYEVTKKIKSNEETRHIPVVLLTALKETSERIKGIEAGCDDFITKPFEKEELLARVRSLLRIKTQHDELKNSYIKLKELEELKENLTSMIVHNLGNPLYGVTITLDVIDDVYNTQLSEEHRLMVSQSKLACEDMRLMISNLLNVSKMETRGIELNLEIFNPYETMKEVAEMMNIKAGFEAKQIILGENSGIPDVSADKGLIKNVIANLVSNSLKFIQEGTGVIDLKMFYDRSEKNVHVQVEDNGMGIPADYLDKVFHKFVQVKGKESRLGSGLGLTFCKLAVEAHKGKIWVTSTLGKGTLFEFTIPITENSKS